MWWKKQVSANLKFDKECGKSIVGMMSHNSEWLLSANRLRFFWVKGFGEWNQSLCRQQYSMNNALIILFNQTCLIRENNGWEWVRFQLRKRTWGSVFLCSFNYNTPRGKVGTPFAVIPMYKRMRSLLRSVGRSVNNFWPFGNVSASVVVITWNPADLCTFVTQGRHTQNTGKITAELSAMLNGRLLCKPIQLVRHGNKPGQWKKSGQWRFLIGHVLFPPGDWRN